MMDYVNVALPKGRLGDTIIDVFESVGVDTREMKSSTRKLIFTDEKHKIRFFLAKPSDVPTYVEYGAADLGIAGRDTLLEEGRNLYEVLNLKYGNCRMVLAGPSHLKDRLDNMVNKRVATKYPHIAREYFEHRRKESIEIIKLNGSVELAPLVGLAEFVVDLVESGRTLEENNLVIFDTIEYISARLVVNRVSMKMKSEKIRWIIDEVGKVINIAKDI